MELHVGEQAHTLEFGKLEQRVGGIVKGEAVAAEVGGEERQGRRRDGFWIESEAAHGSLIPAIEHSL